MFIILQLYGVTKNKLQGLNQYKDYYIESELSGDKTLSFLYPASLSENIVEEGYIRNKTDEFVIKEISKQGNWKTIKAKLNVEELEGKVFESFDTTNETITDCINLALAGTGWIVGVCNVTKRRTVRKTNSSSWDIIQEAKKVYRCELEFDALNKKVNIYEKRGSDKGVYFLDSLNLKELSIQGDSYDFYTRIIAKGKDDLKVTLENFQYSSKVKTYIWKDERYTDIDSLTEDAKAKLDELSKPYRAYSATIIDLANISKEEYKDILAYSLGDVITLVSKENRIKEKQRIVKIIEYPDDPARNTCEIANTTLSFEDIQKEFQDTTDTVNNITTDNGTIDGSTIDGISTEQIYDFESNIAKITNLEAVNARIEELYSAKANISELNTVVANIAELNSTKANITDLSTINTNIKKLIAEDAKINTALINKADIAELNAVQGNISSLDTKIANIQTLLNGNLSSENIQAGGITSDKLTIADGFIKNAMIDNLDISKLNAGNISTNKFRIISDNGGIEIVGATQQFRDKNNKVRIQMGQDAKGNFNFILRGEDGTTTLIDHTGIKEKAIADNLIKGNMVATDSIGEKQINYSSLITGLNKDTNTQLIKASKVAIDLAGQTLDIAFNSLKSNVDSIEIGGRNLAQKTSSSFSTPYTNFTGIANTCPSLGKVLTDGLSVGDTVIVRLVYKYTNIIATDGKIAQCWLQGTGNITSWGSGSFNSSEKKTLSGSGEIEFLHRIKITENHLKNEYWNTQIRHDYVKSGSVQWKLYKVEKGTKATDWTPAQEDIESSISSVREITESNSTTIGVMQGQITTAINNTQIVKDGQTVLLKDDYNRTVTKVDSINSTIGIHTTKLDKLTNNITSVDTKVNSIERDLEGTKSIISSNTSLIDELNSTVINQNSSIAQLQNKIALKVEATDIDYAKKEAIKESRKIIDTRNTNENPKWYFENYPNQTITEFKIASVLGVVSTPVFGTLETKTPWDNFSGGYPVQTFGSNSTATYQRKGTSDTSWSNWIQLEDSEGAQLKADKALEFSKDFTTTEITKTNNKVVSIETDLLGITQKVASTESIINTHTVQLENVDNKINTTQTNAKNYTDSKITSVNQTITNKIAEIKTTTDNITSSISKVEQIATSSLQGKMLYTDLTFKKGLNDIKVYNNAGNGNVVLTRVAKTSDCPTSSGYMIQITSNGQANPGLGGFTFGTKTRANAIFVTKFLAKIPSGYKIGFGTNPIGSNGKHGWLTDNVGTGTWKEYIYKVNCGDSGTFSTTNFFYLNGSAPVTWYLAIATTYDITETSNIESRIETAEQKITPSAITTTISSAITGGTGSISTTQFILDRNGATIKNGAFKVLSTLNSEIASINQNNWMRLQGLELFGVGECMQNKGAGVRSMKLISTDGRASHVDFNENSNVEYTVRLIREALSKSLTLLGNGLTIMPNTPNTPSALEIRSQANIAHIDLTTNPIDDYHVRVYIKNNDKNLYIDGNGLIVQGDLRVTGSKNCLQKTTNYGDRLINAYETTENFYGDLGFGKINENRECVIYIDDIFQECVNTNVDYHVFTQAYYGTIDTIERHSTYFIVKGAVGTEFSWEIKAKRINNENTRLDTLEIDNYIADGLKTFSDTDFLVETSEDTLIDLMTFKLEDILMEE